MNDLLSGFTERVLFEDNHLIIVNKLPSEIVQSDKTGDPTLAFLVKAYIREKYKKPGDVYLGVVHRIDRPVSGAVIFARRSKALSRMNELLKLREVRKVYLAVVKNLPEATTGTLEHYLLKREKQNKSYVVSADTAGAKLASLSYSLLASGKHYHLLQVQLHTGRHHQIRAQLAAIGSPIRGDVKYGYPRPCCDGSILLHAWSVEFVHPVSGQMVIAKAPIPMGDALWRHFSEMEAVNVS